MVYLVYHLTQKEKGRTGNAAYRADTGSTSKGKPGVKSSACKRAKRVSKVHEYAWRLLGGMRTSNKYVGVDVVKGNVFGYASTGRLLQELHAGPHKQIYTRYGNVEHKNPWTFEVLEDRQPFTFLVQRGTGKNTGRLSSKGIP